MRRSRFEAGFALRNCQTLQMGDAGGPVSKLVRASQTANYRLMLWMLANQRRVLPHFKIGKFETWGNGAPHKRPRFPIGHVRSEPVSGRDRGLKDLPGIRIVSQQQGRI